MNEEELALEAINENRANLGTPAAVADWNNVFMRSLSGQMVQGFSTNALAAAITTNDFTIEQRRGNVQALRIVAASNTLADIDQDTFTLVGNGVEIFTDVPLLYYSPLFDSYRDKREYVTIKQNSTINLSVDRTNGVNPVFVYIMAYYAPYDVLPPFAATTQR